MTTPIPNEDPSFSSLLKPDPNTNVGPMAFQVNRNWKKELANASGIVARLQAVGREMEREMQEIVPRGKTGHLADSIYSKVVQGRDAQGRFTGTELVVGDSADYALPVEFGHHIPSTEEFVDARPFIRPVVLKKRDFK